MLLKPGYAPALWATWLMCRPNRFCTHNPGVYDDQSLIMFVHIYIFYRTGRPPGPEMENAVNRESYSLAAGLALGLVMLEVFAKRKK